MQNYHLICQAIEQKRSMTGIYHDRVRWFSPHEIGHGKDGEFRVMTYQYDGESRSGLPYEGEWRCLKLDELTELAFNNDKWHTSDNHSSPNRCIKFSLKRVVN